MLIIGTVDGIGSLSVIFSVIRPFTRYSRRHVYLRLSVSSRSLIFIARNRRYRVAEMKEQLGAGLRRVQVRDGERARGNERVKPLALLQATVAFSATGRHADHPVAID